MDIHAAHWIFDIATDTTILKDNSNSVLSMTYMWPLPIKILILFCKKLLCIDSEKADDALYIKIWFCTIRERKCQIYGA